MTNVLITGGAGFIGSNLAKKLYKLKYNVTVIDNLSYGNIENLKIDSKLICKFIEDDILNENIFKYMKGIDYVFHFAGLVALPTCQSNPKKCIDINVSGFINVLEAARLNDVKRVIFSSTSAIYENNLNFPQNENDIVNPYLLYSNSKYCCELLINTFRKCYDMDIVIVRYFNVYGIGQNMLRKSPPFMAYVIRELLANRVPQLYSSGEQKRDYINVNDVNELNYYCMIKKEAKNQLFNACTGKSYSVKELYNIISKYLKKNIKPNFNKSENFWKSYN